MNLLEMQQFVIKISEKFSEKEDALDILARLTEECGEVASEIRKMEKKGSKIYFNIHSNKEKLADELVDVLNVIASIANLYELNLDTESNRRNAHIKKVLKIEN
ncbi:MAG: MazG nucleotide pyrophosphohydrolase domain-containing protein [Patescibacteria group bacterium]